MDRDISEIDVFQPGFLTDLLGAHQCVELRTFFVEHLVVGMEGTQMPRYMSAKLIGNEFRHASQIFVTIVLSGDDQRGHFDPDTLADHSSECVLHPFKPAFEDLFVVGIVPALQVDIGCIKPARHIFDDLFGLEAVAYEDVLQPSFSGDHTDIFGIGVEDGGFIVGIGNGRSTVFECKIDHAFGTHFYLFVDMCLLGDIPVLAERAFEVAPYRSERERFGTRQQVIKRFLFDRVDIERHRMAIDKVLQFAIFILVDPADPHLPLFELAVVLAEQTDYAFFLF